jgi:ribonuclease R
MIVRGLIRGTRQGFAFLRPDDGGEEIFVAAEQLAGAIHGDRVEATLVRRGPRDFRPEAIVERILERTHPVFSGNVIRLARTPFVIPDTPILPERIRLHCGALAAPVGSKVLFEVEQTPAERPLQGKLLRVLGDAEDPSLDALVVATHHQLPGRFSDEAIDEAVRSADRTDGEDRARRTFFTDPLVLTIDPEDAKDFDDAVALCADDEGYHLQVHIADVSWYVEEGGAVDREACARGTSVYFPGGVIPMLPEVLSTRTASLVPGEERRVLSVLLDLDRDGNLVHTDLAEGIIVSGARLHYAQAQRMLDRDEGDAQVRAALRQMARLAQILRRRRFAAGGFDLEIPEAEMRLGADGVPTSIWRHETLESNRLIEEFMILANRAVGGVLTEHGLPLLYRVHATPDPAALERFAEIVRTILPSARSKDLEGIPAVRRFLKDLPATPMTRVLHSFFLRSMKQAVYAPIDLGHFGLGIDRYCHFTSPIRRYPDLVNHRLVRWAIQHPRGKGARSESIRRLHASAAAIADACSRAERTAERAERDMVRLKSLRWAEARLGEVGWGRIVGCLPAGFFVELEAVPVEGFVPRESLQPRMDFVEERLAFVAVRSHGELRLGDRVEVQIVRADFRERRLDFRLVPRPTGARETPRRRAAGAAGKRKNARAKAVRIKGGRPRADRGKGSQVRKTAKRSRPRGGRGR